MDAKWVESYINCGHEFLNLKSNQEALNQYLKAIRIANLSGQELSDPLLFQKAGQIYISQGKWEDARVMFMMCAEQYQTSFSYFNLGVASYNLGSYDEAERVLGLVNYMDSSNTLTWAYLTLALLNKENPPINAAFETMNEALKLGLNDINLLQEIFVANISVGQYKAAKNVQEHLLVCLANKGHKKMRQFFAQVSECIGKH